MLCLGTVLVSVLLPFPQCQSDVVGTKIVTFLQFGWSTWVEKIQMLYSASRIMRHCRENVKRVTMNVTFSRDFIFCKFNLSRTISDLSQYPLS